MKKIRLFSLLLGLAGLALATASHAASASVTESARQIPVIATVDVVVVGGSSAAVAAAEAAAQAGAKVFLLAPRPYLGEDLAGTMRLWLEPGESVQGTPAAAIWGDKNFVTPLQFKKALDQKLLAAKVEFFYSAYPSDLLVDTAGKPCGVVMADRSGRQAVIAKTIIDASEHAVVAKLAGAQFTPFQAGPVTAKWVAISNKPNEGKNFSVRKLDLKFDLYTNAGMGLLRADATVNRRGKKIDVPPAFGFEYTMSLDLADESWAARAALEQQVRDLAFNTTQQYSADLPFIVPPTWIKGVKSATAADKLDLDACRPAGVERLWVLSGKADVARPQMEKLLRPGSFMSLGVRVGQAAAAQAKGLATPAEVKVAHAAAGAGEPGEVKEALAGLRPVPAAPRIPQPEGALPILGRYDVVVIGGGTAGAPSGIAAARKGAKTLVVEYLDGLGGVGTLGMIGKYFRGNKAGFTTTMPENPLEPRMDWYRTEMRKAGGDVWFETLGCGALVEGNRVTGVIVATPMGRGVVLAKAVVDGTGNSDIAIDAGAQYKFVEDYFALQDSHVPPREVGAWYMNGGYQPTSDHDLIDIRNAFLTKGEKRPNCFDWGQILDSRERRRIVGDFTLDWLDVINQRTFTDSIAWTKTSYDSHGYQIHPFFELRPPRYPENIGFEFKAYVPYRCMLPQGVEGILVTGIGVSAHRDAMPIIRMEPDLQSQGYAAGYAAAMAAQAGITPRQVDVKALQKHLVAIGNLESHVLTDQDGYPLPAAKIAAAVGAVKKNFADLELVLAQPKDSLPLLRQAYGSAEGPDKVAYAEVLGVMGDASGLDTLRKEGQRLLTSADKDDAPPAKSSNVNASDRLSQVIWALGGTRDRQVLPLLSTMTGEIGNNLNRYRAVVVSLMRIGDPASAPTLARLINSLPQKRNYNDVREILAVVALYRCGDQGGLARRKLEQYAVGTKGPWAELAVQVLATKPGSQSK